MSPVIPRIPGKLKNSSCLFMYVGRSNIKRPLSVQPANEHDWVMTLCGSVVGCGGPSSPHRQTHPSPQLVEFKMSEREVPITIAQRVVIKFLTNENVGPNEIWRRLRAQ